MDKVYFYVEVEPTIEPLEWKSFTQKTTSPQDDARLDLQAKTVSELGFMKTHFDFDFLVLVILPKMRWPKVILPKDFWLFAYDHLA